MSETNTAPPPRDPMLDAIRAAILTTSTEDGESRIIDATHALHCLATATGYLIAGVPEGLRLGALRAFARCAAGTGRRSDTGIQSDCRDGIRGSEGAAVMVCTTGDAS